MFSSDKGNARCPKDMGPDREVAKHLDFNEVTTNRNVLNIKLVLAIP